MTAPAARPLVALDLDDDVTLRAPAGRTDAGGSPDAGRLPLRQLGGLAGSGAFAVWTSLTCFVC